MTTTYLTKSEKSKAEKLNVLNNISTFWNDVRKMTAKVHSDKSIREWQYLAERRYDELRTGVENVKSEIKYENGKPVWHYYDAEWNEVFPTV